MTQTIQAVLIGAGQRGLNAYGPYALQHPNQIRFVAVAEPNPERRARFAEQHKIPTHNQFESWEPLLAEPGLGEVALICTQDQMHTNPAVAALEAGYHVLLEKPMATTLEDCRLLVASAEATGKQLHICHVLRYTHHFQQVKEVIDAGILGEIINVSHRENVAWWHMAHSFVRGNWRNTALSSPMILAKCCHDLDILVWLLGDRCDTLNSVGSLVHYRPEKAPQGAPQRCLDGCPAATECRYYAPFIYIDHIPLWRGIADTNKGWTRLVARWAETRPGWVKALSTCIPALKTVSDYRGWPVSTLTNDPTHKNVMTALESGPYGRCVYHCDNDVVDHQVVSMQFEKGTSVTLTMHGHSHLEGRTTRIEGTNATLRSEFSYGNSWIEVNEHASDRRTRYETSISPQSGHGGGDFGLMAGFVNAIQSGDDKKAFTSARTSLESHLMAFAAEEARLGARTIHMNDYRG